MYMCWCVYVTCVFVQVCVQLCVCVCVSVRICAHGESEKI